MSFAETIKYGIQLGYFRKSYSLISVSRNISGIFQGKTQRVNNAPGVDSRWRFAFENTYPSLRKVTRLEPTTQSKTYVWKVVNNKNRHALYAWARDMVSLREEQLFF